MTGRRAARFTPQPRMPLLRVNRPTLVAAATTGVILIPLAVLATTSMLGAIAAIVAAVLVLGLVTLGLDHLAQALVILGAFLAPMNDLTPSGGASFVTAADAAFLLGFLLMMPNLLPRELRLPPAFLIGATGVASIALISSMLSEDPVLSLNSTARLLVGAFGLAVLISWWGPDRKRVVALAWAYVLGNVVSVAYGIVDGPALNDGRIFGLTEHPNIFGLCALLALVLVPFLITQTTPEYRWIPVVAGVVCLYGIWVSGSRGALAALIAVAVVYPLLRRSIPAALTLLGVFAVGVAFSEPLLSGTSSEGNALGRLLGGGSADASDTAREQLADQAVEQFVSNPILGVGLAEVLAAHVIYLQIAAGLGVIGLTFYLLALWATARPAMVLTPPFNLLALPALAYGTLGFVTPVLWDRYIWIVLALSLLAPRLAAEADEQQESDRAEGAIADASA